MEVIVYESEALMLQEFGAHGATEWGTGLQEKIRLLSNVRESLIELIHFKGIRL